MMALLRLCRLYYALPMSFIFALTVCYALDGQMAGQWQGLGLSTAAVALVIAAGYVLNDVCDRSIDRVNVPDRPVAAGQVKPNAALSLAITLVVIAVVLASLCRWPFVLVLAGVTVMLILYDLTSKRLGLGKQLLVAALMASLYPLAIVQAGGFTGPRGASLVLFAIWLFMTSFGYEVLKDIRDRVGDRVAATRPGWIDRRPRLARNIAGIIVVGGAVVLFAPCSIVCGTAYLVIVSFAVACAIVSIFVPIPQAMTLIYAECVIVGIAATTDLILATVP